jgi:hypothetical protein
MLKRRFLFLTVMVVVLSVGLMGCPPGMKLAKEDLPQTPQEKSDYFMGYYVSQKADYKARLARATTLDPASGEVVWLPTTTKIEKAVLRAKYQFITKGEKPITLYDTYVSQGQVPTAQMEAQVFALISWLEQELIKAGQQQ